MSVIELGVPHFMYFKDYIVYLSIVFVFINVLHSICLSSVMDVCGVNTSQLQGLKYRVSSLLSIFFPSSKKNLSKLYHVLNERGGPSRGYSHLISSTPRIGSKSSKDK